MREGSLSVLEKVKCSGKNLWIILGFALLSCLPAESGELNETKPAATKKLFQRGEVLYQQQCAVCHGPQGAGDGQAAYLLNPKPRNFVKDKFRFVSTSTQEATDENLFKVITRGMAGSAMPPWEHLSDKDRWAIVYYVRYLSEIEKYKQAGEINDAMIKKGLTWEQIKKIVNKKMSQDIMIKVPSEPQLTQESLSRGRELFVASCAGCHGVQGKGDGQQNMVDNLGFPVKPRDLTAGIFKGDATSEELYFRFIAGLPGSPMPSYAGVFTQEQIWELIHFVQSLIPSTIEGKGRLHKMQLVARKVSGDVEMNPLANQWLNVEPVYVVLTPLWWSDKRIEGVQVRAIHNTQNLALLLTWEDPKKDDNLVEVQSFSDGVALQFSMEKDPPFFGMGSKGHPVYIWHWKAAWEQKGKERLDIEKHYSSTASDWYLSQKDYQYGQAFETSESETRFHDPQFITGWGAGNPLSDPQKEESSEGGLSEGLGTYTTHMVESKQVKANGIWSEGKWHVIFVRSLKGQDHLKFRVGDSISVAFAIWDGSQKDRNGQKSVSIWNTLVLEK